MSMWDWYSGMNSVRLRILCEWQSCLSTSSIASILVFNIVFYALPEMVAYLVWISYRRVWLHMSCYVTAALWHVYFICILYMYTLNVYCILFLNSSTCKTHSLVWCMLLFFKLLLLDRMYDMSPLGSWLKAKTDSVTILSCTSDCAIYILTKPAFSCDWQHRLGCPAFLETQHLNDTSQTLASL